MIQALRHRQLQLLLLVGVILIFVLLAGSSLASAAEDTASSSAPPLPTRLVIPAISVDASVSSVGYRSNNSVASWQTVDRGIGWHQSSAVPGFPGNAVFSGHNGTRGDRVFRNLHKMAVDDTFTIYVDGDALTYEVSERVILREFLATSRLRRSNAAWLAHTDDERVTLITCYPPWANTHRLVIVAHPLTIPARGTLRAEFE